MGSPFARGVRTMYSAREKKIVAKFLAWFEKLDPEDAEVLMVCIGKAIRRGSMK